MVRKERKGENRTEKWGDQRKDKANARGQNKSEKDRDQNSCRQSEGRKANKMPVKGKGRERDSKRTERGMEMPRGQKENEKIMRRGGEQTKKEKMHIV